MLETLAGLGILFVLFSIQTYLMNQIFNHQAQPDKTPKSWQSEHK